MLQNKLIYELRTHLCLGKDNRMAEHIINNMFYTIKQQIKFISPIYLIETAVFNLLIPISLCNLKGQKSLCGKFLEQAVVGVLLSIVKYAKDIRINQTIAYKLAVIFIQVYKKDHILYKQKLLYLNKILNI